MRDARLEVGHADIDAQHAAILDEVERLAAHVSADDAPALEAALGRLWDLVLEHFAAEESLMFAHAYPERAAHASAHHLFLRELRDVQVELAERGLTDDAAARARRRIPEWFEFHNERNDAPLARFLARAPAAAGGSQRPRRSRGEDA